MKYSDEITTEICKYLQAGNNQEDSAVLAGINPDTFYTWKKEKPDFSEAIKKAERKCKARNIAFVQQAAEKSWQAAAWYLERKYHDEYALKNISEIGGKDGQPIQYQFIGGGFVPPTGPFIASPTGSNIQSLPEVQDPGVAPAGEKDNNSDNGAGTPSA